MLNLFRIQVFEATITDGETTTKEIFRQYFGKRKYCDLIVEDFEKEKNGRKLFYKVEPVNAARIDGYRPDPEEEEDE